MNTNLDRIQKWKKFIPELHSCPAPEYGERDESLYYRGNFSVIKKVLDIQDINKNSEEKEVVTLKDSIIIIFFSIAISSHMYETIVYPRHRENQKYINKVE